MTDISKSFPGVRALAGVNLEVRAGEVHALVGENGAGKSTLIKILTGVYPLESGRITLDGRDIAPSSPREAQRLGISAIHQEVDLLPYLSVAENIYIGRQPRRLARIDWRELNSRASRAMRRLGIEIDVTEPLGSYPVAIRQMVSIARAIDLNCRVLVMDEPTSSLDESEVEQLFEVVRRLSAAGAGIVFITHFLDQLYRISNRITVLRNGERVGVFETQSLPKTELVAHMLGRSVEVVESLLQRKAERPDRAPARAFMTARGLSRRGSVRLFDLDIHSGEVVGLAGLLGSGRTEAARLLFGIDRPDEGEITVEGTKVSHMSPKTAIRLGIGFSPEDRRTEGIVPDLSVRENILLAVQARVSRFGLVSRAREAEIAEHFVNALGIATPHLDQPVRFLSGGNQQKVILARWLALQPRMLILDEPTRGIDVGAKAEVESLVESLSRDGVAVLFISSELDEVLRRSHRIAVMRDREKVAELDAEMADEGLIMNLIAGGADHASRDQ